MYLSARQSELSEETLRNQGYRLESFVAWCEDREIDNLNDLTARNLNEFRQDRLEQVEAITLRGQLQTLRKYLEFAASIDAVEPGLRERVLLPVVDPEDEVSDALLEESRARAILDHLEQFNYASRDHVLFALMWHAGLRLGTVRALDVDDFDPDEQCVDVYHRPETGTPLKNGHGAERSVALGSYYVTVLEDYIRNVRVKTTDEYGRRPLVTSTQGRYSPTAVRDTTYWLTRPCMVGPCPHGEDPDTCQWTKNKNHAHGCPSTLSPHPVRRGAITRMLREGTPDAIVADRVNDSLDVLEKHYDQRTEREKMRVRRQFIQDL
jgi:site-specific recombinase XerD